MGDGNKLLLCLGQAEEKQKVMNRWVNRESGAEKARGERSTRVEADGLWTAGLQNI